MQSNLKRLSSLSLLLTPVLLTAAHANAIHTEINPTWTRPATATAAAASLTTTAEWDGFAATSATNDPTGTSAFGGSVVPTAGDSSFSSSGSFLIANGSATNAYYSAAQTGDIYSFSGVITPQITMPGYGIAGNQLNVLLQVESDGSAINTSLLTANGVAASSLPNFSVTQTFTDGGTDSGFGIGYRDDTAWTFTLPADTSSLQLSLGWGVVSSALVSAVVDTQSVPSTVPEPVTLGLLVGCALMLRRVRVR